MILSVEKQIYDTNQKPIKVTHETAVEALQDAATAQETADTAQTTANTAQTTAENAQAAANDAATAAATAEATATEALNKHGFCSCTTAAGTAAKTASLTGFQLQAGSTVHVTFTNANTVANPTLNINGTGAKAIKWNNAAVAASPSPWAAGECVAFVYDGTNWVISGQSNITADNIVSGSITADRIKANVISAVNGGTGSINADKIQANVISAVNNGTGTINADKINVSGITIGQSQVTGLTTALKGKETAGAAAAALTNANSYTDTAAANAAKTATNYITNISGGGITVTGNSATSKIEIANTVKVIRDSTHFAEMTSSEFKIHAGNATYPITSISTSTGYFGGDGAGNYLMAITRGYSSLDPSLVGGVLNIRDTNNTSRVTIGAFGQFGIANFNNSAGRTLVEIGGNSSGYGNFAIFNGAATNRQIAELTTMTIYSGSVKLVDNEPTLKFTDSNGYIRSWYSLKRAYINDGSHQGYVVYGNTGTHGITVDYLTSGRINFYVDTTSIGYATITSSDERMKTDIEPIEERYKRAAGSVELKNFRFDFNDPTRAGANLLKRFGAIAQDVIKALDDEGINYEENELVETLEDDNGEYYTINYVPFLIARLAADEDRINELTTRLEALERR